MGVGGDAGHHRPIGAIDATGAAASLDARLFALPGVGPRTAERLRAGGLATIGDLLFHLPRAYDDLRRVVRLADLAALLPGQVVLVRGTVTRVRVFPRRLLDVIVGQDGVSLRARWFRPPRGMQKSFARGDDVLLAGPLRSIDGGDLAGGFEIVQPSVHREAPPKQGAQGGLGVRPRYPAVAGVSGRVLEKIIAAAVDRHAGEVAEVLAPAARDRLGLLAVAEALRAVHARAGHGDLDDGDIGALAAGRSQAHRRLAFDELLVLQLGLATMRRQTSALAAPACAATVTSAAARASVCAALPFALTAGQQRAVDEIARDLTAPHPMQRLLVGDVGSGKTAVAFVTAALVAAAGGQTLLMAPTEVLVEQHVRTIGVWAQRLGLGVARFTAAMPRAERAQTLARCRAGGVHILIGTQALLEARAELGLPDLRLAIVDEQHRFGVAQRARLRTPIASAAPPGMAGSAAGALPHLLVMSATPIPRTLALTLYGDLDATFLRESPPGRLPITTEICAGAERRRDAYQRLQDVVREGRQAYVVCPVRERAARAGAITAVRRAAELRRQLGPAGVRVGLLHGDLDAADKEALLRRFARGDIDVLVATTVVELGLDVPNAAVMLIEEADRFGLSQLHQLRGRVGRGAFAGTCLLCPADDTGADSDAGRRLAELAASQDGFHIAEADLALRGPGDLFGERQAGASRVRFGGLADQIDLLEQARAEAIRIAAGDPALARTEHEALRAAVSARWAARAVFGEESG